MNDSSDQPGISAEEQVPGVERSAYHALVMAKRWSIFLAVTLLATLSFAKDKNKTTLPPYVLQAKTIAVIIDPNTQFSLDDPHANAMAQRDVEAALLKWGKFEPVSDAQSADLVVVVRRGNGRQMDDTSPDARQNNGSVFGQGNGGGIGGHGAQPGLPGDGQQNPGSPGGFGYTQDFFAVFKAGDNPRSAAPLWKYFGQEGLNPAGVPAVTAFRKAVETAEKAAAEKH
jgi:hypothetical protein